MGAASSTKELMQRTLEQSQQVLFHGLAFGTADSLSLGHYKSQTTTPPSNQRARKPGRTNQGSRNAQTRIESVLAAMGGQGATIDADVNDELRRSLTGEIAPKQLISNTFDGRVGGGLTAASQTMCERINTSRPVASCTKAPNKPRLRIHTRIDDNFQIQSSLDAETDAPDVQQQPRQDEPVASPQGGTDTVIEIADMAEITGKEKNALESFRFASNQLLNQSR